MRDYDEDNVNRQYFLWYVEQNLAPGGRILDFGCGSGKTVRLLRAHGFDAYGVDIHWPGADYGDLEALGLPEGALRYYEEGGPLPFEDGTFDLLISDQVIEHVGPLESTVAELRRVLKPGGLMYHHFPSLSTVREGHIGIPMAHRLRPGRARAAYVTALRRLGAGVNKDDRPPTLWAKENLEWIDRYTRYRSVKEIERVLGTGATVTHRELDYARFRARGRPGVSRVLAQPGMGRPAALAFRWLGFEAVEIRLDRV